MKPMLSRLAPVFALAAALGACSPDGRNEAEPSAGGAQEAAPPTVAEPSAPVGTENPATGPAATPATVLGLEGLGDLRIDQPVPTGASWSERGAQTGEACRTVTSPDYPGVYAIVADGAVRRITLGQRSTVKLVEGIGVGSSEQDVMKWFAGFRDDPHKYQAAPAKYLTAPNAADGGSALRFEIGSDGRVGMIHVGVMPALGYVEGCS